MSEAGEVLVVGSGIAGILAAHWAQACGHRVRLLERGPELGGLLRSWRAPDGLVYDIGTHIPVPTGDARCDALVFDPPEAMPWHQLPVLKVGNWFSGCLNTTSQFIDISALPRERWQEGLAALLAEPGSDEGAPNLADALRLHFGEPLYREVFEPLLRRFYEAPFEQLSPDAHRFLGYSRVIAGPAAMCRELKRSALYDRKIGFASYLEGRSGRVNVYPVEGGMGGWIERRAAALRAAGATLETGVEITGIDAAVRQVALRDGRRLAFSDLVWTGPVAQVGRALGRASEGAAPRFVPLSIVHLRLDRPPAVDCHYLYLNDVSMRGFRATLYDNFCPGPAGAWRVTVEALTRPDGDSAALAAQVVDELLRAGILAPGTVVKVQQAAAMPQGFPEISIAGAAAARRLSEWLASTHPWLLLCGRGGGDVFFMDQVLRSTAARLEKRFGAPTVRQAVFDNREAR